MKSVFGTVNAGNFAVGETGTQINQTAKDNSIGLHQQIRSFMDAVEAHPENTLDAERKSKALTDQTHWPTRYRGPRHDATNQRLL